MKDIKINKLEVVFDKIYKFLLIVSICVTIVAINKVVDNYCNKINSLENDVANLKQENYKLQENIDILKENYSLIWNRNYEDTNMEVVK